MTWSNIKYTIYIPEKLGGNSGPYKSGAIEVSAKLRSTSISQILLPRVLSCFGELLIDSETLSLLFLSSFELTTLVSVDSLFWVSESFWFKAFFWVTGVLWFRASKSRLANTPNPTLLFSFTVLISSGSLIFADWTGILSVWGNDCFGNCSDVCSFGSSVLVDSSFSSSEDEFSNISLKKSIGGFFVLDVGTWRK